MVTMNHILSFPHIRQLIMEKGKFDTDYLSKGQLNRMSQHIAEDTKFQTMQEKYQVENSHIISSCIFLTAVALGAYYYYNKKKV